MAVQAVSKPGVSPESQVAELLAAGTSLSVAAADLSAMAASLTKIAMNQLYGGADVPCTPGTRLSPSAVGTASPSSASGKLGPSDQVVFSGHALGDAAAMPKDVSCNDTSVFDHHRSTLQDPSAPPKTAVVDGNNGSPASLWDTFGTVVRSKVGVEI
jgi:hypothetical protein